MGEAVVEMLVKLVTWAGTVIKSSVEGVAVGPKDVGVVFVVAVVVVVVVVVVAVEVVVVVEFELFVFDF